MSLKCVIINSKENVDNKKKNRYTQTYPNITNSPYLILGLAFKPSIVSVSAKFGDSVPSELKNKQIQLLLKYDN